MSKLVFSAALLTAGCGPSGPGAVALDHLIANPETYDRAAVRTCGWMIRDRGEALLTTDLLWDEDSPGVDVELKHPTESVAWADWRCISGELRNVCGDSAGVCMTSGVSYDWIIVER